MSNKEGKEVKEGSKETVLDIKQITDYLNHAMRQASQGLKATRSKDGVKSPLYELQVEFCYMMYEITSGPLRAVSRQIG